MGTRIRTYIRDNRASRGQIIILVALFAVVLTGMVGLAIDLGYTFAERRSVQNAADAAALAGAHALTQWSLTNPTLSANGDVSTVVDANKMNASTTQTFTCLYIDDNGDSQGNCSIPVPATATGVQVVVHETHNTFFMRVFPFGAKTASTAATATAHVQAISDGTLGSDSPFILCGSESELYGGGTLPVLLSGSAFADPTSDPTATFLNYQVASKDSYQVQFLNNGNGNGNNPTPTPTATGTGTTGTTNGTYTVNPLAYGKTFLLHDSQVPDCGAHANRFKGVADNVANSGKSIPGLFDYDHGDRAGPTRFQVRGIQGCDVGTTAKTANNCVLIVPVAYGSTNDQLAVKTVAAFLVSQCSPSGNCHKGVLLQDYQIQPDGMGEWTGANGWHPGYKGLATTRLTR